MCVTVGDQVNEVEDEVVDWGVVRSTIHTTNATASDKAKIIDVHLPPFVKSGVGDVLRSYVLDYFPEWMPGTFQLPYDLAQKWMDGELMDLLCLMLQNSGLKYRLVSDVHKWSSGYRSLESLYSGIYSDLCFSTICLENASDLYMVLASLASGVEVYVRH